MYWKKKTYHIQMWKQYKITKRCWCVVYYPRGNGHCCKDGGGASKLLLCFATHVWSYWGECNHCRLGSSDSEWGHWL
jgi:hypothetical protein